MNLETNVWNLQAGVPLSMYDKVRTLAKDKDVSVSSLIRKWILEGIKRELPK